MRIAFPSAEEHKGFTLVELLLVMGIVGGLLAVTIIAINPGKQLKAARDTERRLMVQAQDKGLKQYTINAGGASVAGLPAAGEEPKPICRVGVTDPSCVSFDTLKESNILVNIPDDRDETSELLTGYRVYKESYLYRVCNDYLEIGDPMRCSNSTQGGGSGSSSVSSDSSASDGISSSSEASASASSDAVSTSSFAASEPVASESPSTSSSGASVASESAPTSSGLFEEEVHTDEAASSESASAASSQLSAIAVSTSSSSASSAGVIMPSTSSSGVPDFFEMEE